MMASDSAKEQTRGINSEMEEKSVASDFIIQVDNNGSFSPNGDGKTDENNGSRSANGKGKSK